MTEAHYYNAVNVALEGNYSALTKLRTRFSSWKDAWEATPRAPEPQKLWSVLEEKNITLLLKEDSSFPRILKEIPLCPFGIYVRGTLPDLSLPWIAIVGTRKATREGKQIAENFSREFARKQCVIVSGLAFGIDAAAHTGALQETNGKTVAVLSSGVLNVTPRTNAYIAEAILKSGGAIISEYPPEAPTFPYRFLERNRIISGLSKAVVVVEAPERSGALATARFANEQNRDVFAVPGPATHPHYKGSHALIRDGAILASNAEEVLSDLGIETGMNASFSFPEVSDNAEYTAILNAMQHTGRPVSSDELVEQCGLDAASVQRSLGILSIQGIIKESGNSYSLS